MPDHSTFSNNRHGRVRGSDLVRRLFDTVLARCITEGLVGGDRVLDDLQRETMTMERGSAHTTSRPRQPNVTKPLRCIRVAEANQIGT